MLYYIILQYSIVCYLILHLAGVSDDWTVPQRCATAEACRWFVGWSNDHLNHMRFRHSLETKIMGTCAAEWSLRLGVFWKIKVVEIIVVKPVHEWWEPLSDRRSDDTNRCAFFRGVRKQERCVRPIHRLIIWMLEVLTQTDSWLKGWNSQVRRECPRSFESTILSLRIGHAHDSVYIYIYIICVCIYIYIYVCICVLYIYIYIYIYVYTHIEYSIT